MSGQATGTPEDRSDIFAQALILRREIAGLSEDLVERRGWDTVGRILLGRLDAEFQAFLDAPCRSRLRSLEVLLTDTRRLDQRFPGMRPGFRVYSAES